jgi:basic membrane protein A and related proteins
MYKKIINILLVMALAIVTLAGCGQKTKEADAGKTAKKVKVGVIYTKAKLGGNSFNDLVFEGVKKAKTDFGIEYTNVEPNTTADQENALETMSSSNEYGLVIVVGEEQKDVLKKIAEKYPEQKFAYIDAILDLPNIASYAAKEHEGAFLVGALAALAKEEKVNSTLDENSKFGFIGGVNVPLINKFYAGYLAGIKYVNPKNEVIADYVGGFNDPSTAKVIAGSMNQKGVKVAFHAAGASGIGMFQAANEKGFLAIGVNSNQNSLYPNNIMATMLKKVDSAAYSAISDIIKGKFSQGANYLGLKEEGVGYTVEGSNIKLSKETIAKVNEIKDKVNSGELKIPDTVEAVEAFLKNNKYSK